MSQSAPAADLSSHRVFPAEIRGVALVVRPRGDAIEFTHAQISTELTRLKEELQRPEVDHLILNLSGSNYFGSEMIGLFVQLGTLAREVGGQSAMCAISADMRGVLKVMRLDKMWLVFDSEELAVRNLAAEPSPPLLKRRSFWLIIVLLLIAGGVGAFLATRPQAPDQIVTIHSRLEETWQTAVRRRTSDMGQNEWKLYSAETIRQLNRDANRLAEPPLNGQPAAPHLRTAILQGIIPLLADRDARYSPLQRSYQEAMDEAAKHLPASPSAP